MDLKEKQDLTSYSFNLSSATTDFEDVKTRVAARIKNIQVTSEGLNPIISPKSNVSHLQLNNGRGNARGDTDLDDSRIDVKNAAYEIKKQVLDLAERYLNDGFKKELNQIYGKKLPSTWVQSITFRVTLNEENISNLVNPLSTFVVPGNMKRDEIPQNFWMLIHVCKSADNIWGILFDDDHRGKIEDLSDNMNEFYQKNKAIAAAVTQGSYYGLQDSSYWHRVKCLEINGLHATIFFIDRGDEDIVHVERLCKLDHQFSTIPAQAMQISLSNLDLLSNLPETNTILEKMICEKAVFISKINEIDDSNGYLLLSVKQIFLKSDGNLTDVCNTTIDRLFKSVLNPHKHIQLDNPMPARLTHINDKNICIQLLNQSSITLSKLLDEVAKKYFADESYNVKANFSFERSNKMYFIVDEENKKLFRAKLLKCNEKTEAYLVDVGSKINLVEENAILAETLSAVLSIYPIQAITANLHQIPFCEKEVIKELENTILKNETIFVKFHSLETHDDIPSIEIFKNKNDSMNCLLSMNNRLLQINNSALAINSCNIVEETSLPKRQSLSSIVSPPNIEYDGIYDCQVVHVIDPLYFVTQPLRSKKSLEKMGEEMKKVYESYTGSKKIFPKIGQLYAFKDALKGEWFRAYITKIKDKKEASIYLIDFGTRKTVPAESLVPLDEQFFKLPSQAVWAKLYGIKPVCGVWTSKDCKRFKELTVSKNFAANVKGKRSLIDSQNPPTSQSPIIIDTIYELELVDVNTSEDIYISKILIDENKALKKEDEDDENY